ncbi:MAG: MBL fold metallo-hydrolase, partial [Bdellovibrionales bacterium]
MRMHLRWEFFSGQFGDPALYVWDINKRNAMLFDCGDLSHFSIRQLLKVSHIFLSHCHIDHFFGFDHFLRVHVGSEKTVTIMGPPHTSERVAGKLQGYTWNLIWDQNLEFIVVDLDTERNEKKICHFRAKDGFRPSLQTSEPWDKSAPIFDSGTYKVTTTTIDHRTPSMAYAVEEKISVGVNSAELRQRDMKTGPWLNELKSAFLAGDFDRQIDADVTGGSKRTYSVSQLAQWLLLPRHRHKIAYVTDGGAHEQNFSALLELIRNSDVLFAETCFIEADRALADETKHFTARFIGRLAQESNVKRL